MNKEIDELYLQLDEQWDIIDDIDQHGLRTPKSYREKAICFLKIADITEAINQIKKSK